MAGKRKDEAGGLVNAARTLGSAAGKVASLLGSKSEAAPAQLPKTGKLPKKNKHRLPRKQKKALQRAAAPAQTREDPAGRL